MNKEGYRDPTAEKAVHNASKIPWRIREVMDAMNKVASLHGLEIVAVKDKHTGKEWRGRPMEMTREQLEQYRSNMEEIKELTYKLEHLGDGDSLIGNDVVFDYRSGFPKPQSVVGYDYDLEARRRERLENLRAKIQADCDNVEEFIFGISDGKIRRIFQMYFLEGLSQEKVARKMNMDRSSISKKITDYMQLSHNSHQSRI